MEGGSTQLALPCTRPPLLQSRVASIMCERPWRSSITGQPPQPRPGPLGPLAPRNLIIVGGFKLVPGIYAAIPIRVSAAAPQSPCRRRLPPSQEPLMEAPWPRSWEVKSPRVTAQQPQPQPVCLVLDRLPSPPAGTTGTALELQRVERTPLLLGGG